eukprot:GFUD01038679.1.p1 GENE.GFUD01038679.1~~GFUD01038679.1.p1  ORF type:complete len:124 (+),score=30.16 GFUD01038679.1:162-533(+)
MASLCKFGALRTKFAGLADFVTIYIEEAHPAERKHFSGNYAIDTHASMEQRMEAADTLREEGGEFLAGCPILVDQMDNRANLAYASFPERLYVIQDSKIIFEGGTGPWFYSIEEVDKFISKIV